MEESKPTRLPMMANLDVTHTGGRLYQSLLGGLLHVNLGTRPDICFAINALSRVTKEATSTHLAYLRKVLQYLRHNNNCELYFKFSTSKTVKLELEVDASYASGPERKSLYGFIIWMNNAPVMFRTKMENVIALSSCEAELIAISEACKSLGFVENLLKFLGVEYSTPIEVYNDNRGAINIINNRKAVRRCRHIELRHFFLQDWIDKGRIEVLYRSSGELTADLLTKALGTTKFWGHTKKLLCEAPKHEEGVGSILN